jgi:hypothetical protein
MEDPEFLAQMARELDATLRKLEQREDELRELLGPERVEDLRLLWAKELDAEDEKDIKHSMDWDDKELIWVWARLERARAKRVLAGRQSMITLQYGAGEKKESGESVKEPDKGM